MAQFELNRTKDKSKIDTQAIKDGSAYLAVDEQSQSGDLYIDYDKKRYNVSGNVGYKKITTKGFKIIGWQGEHNCSASYTSVATYAFDSTPEHSSAESIPSMNTGWYHFKCSSGDTEFNNKLKEAAKKHAYITLMNDMNVDSYCQIVGLDTSYDIGIFDIYLYVNKLYTNSSFFTYDADNYTLGNKDNYKDTSNNNALGSVITNYPDLGWMIKARENNSTAYSQQACLFINDYPELGTFDWFNDSYALAKDNLAQGKVSFAQGQGNKAYGKYSAVFGNNNKAGYADAVFGRGNDASGAQVSFIAGQENTISDLGSYHAVFGAGNKVSGGTSKFVAGRYNEDKETSVFEIGQGSSNSDRRNVFEVDKSGRPVINGTYMKGQTLFDNLLMNREQSRDYLLDNYSTSLDWSSNDGILLDNNEGIFPEVQFTDPVEGIKKATISFAHPDKEVVFNGTIGSTLLDDDTPTASKVVIYASEIDTVGTTFYWDELNNILSIEYTGKIYKIEVYSNDENDQLFQDFCFKTKINDAIFKKYSNSLLNNTPTQYGPYFCVEKTSDFTEEDEGWYVLVVEFDNKLDFSPTEIMTWYHDDGKNNYETAGAGYRLSDVTFKIGQTYTSYLPIYITKERKLNSNSSGQSFLVARYGFYFQSAEKYKYEVHNVKFSLFKARSITMDENLPNYNYEIISYSTPYFITNNEYTNGNFYNYNFSYNPKCFVMESNKHLYLFPTVQVTATTYYPGNIWISDKTERAMINDIKQISQIEKQFANLPKYYKQKIKKYVNNDFTYYYLPVHSNGNCCIILAYDVDNMETLDKIASAKITVLPGQYSVPNSSSETISAFYLQILGDLDDSLDLTQISVINMELLDLIEVN